MMNIYIPFIHKIIKKEKKQEPLPLYIEEYIDTKINEKNIDNQEKEDKVIIIELF
jgi:hypothetical protein